MEYLGYPQTMDPSDDIISIYRDLSSSLDGLVGESPVLAYNVLSYAGDNHEAYIRMAVDKGARTVMLGMNPGPYGMAQTGVPFGAVSFVRSYLGIDGEVGHPVNESPLRPVTGMETRRDEASGRAVWTMASRYGGRDEFLSRCTVLNYCPLLFLDDRGRNLTPDHLPRDFRSRVEKLCSASLSAIIAVLAPSSIIALGRYAEGKAKECSSVPVYYFPHPSPLNPSSSSFWKEKALDEFRRITDAS